MHAYTTTTTLYWCEKKKHLRVNDGRRVGKGKFRGEYWGGIKTDAPRPIR